MNDKEKDMESETTIRDRSAVDWALLVARIVVGAVFMAHGAQKLFGAFGWPSYRRVLPQTRHSVSKGGTLQIKRHNLNFRTRLKRLQ